MKPAVNIARILVALLFIFSGLVKADDPLGLSYKMQEFFDLWHLSSLNGISLSLSVFMIAFEIIAGVALLLGWQMRLFSWLLLLLIVFFTFLTGYAYFSGKFTSCGCFGDCIPITPKTSFLKDVVLLLMILYLFANRKNIKPLLPKIPTVLLMLLTVILSFGIQWYMLSYLPVIDCLPFKKDKNIALQMKPPPGSVEDSFSFVFLYEKEGKQFEFSGQDLPEDIANYHFIKRDQKLIRKGNATPAIKDFTLSGYSGQDSVQVVLSQPYAVLLFCEDFSSPVAKWEDNFAKLYAEAKAKNIPVYVVTALFDEAQQVFSDSSFNGIIIFKSDIVAIHTAARANPTIYLLEHGTIRDKQSYKRMSRISSQVRSLPVQQTLPASENSSPEQVPTSNQ